MLKSLTSTRRRHAQHPCRAKDKIGRVATKADLAGPFDDTRTVELKVEGNELKIGATKAIVADLAWKKGAIPLLEDELG
jgi:hypothetical protein